MRTALLILGREGERLPASGDFRRAGFAVSTAVARSDGPARDRGTSEEAVPGQGGAGCEGGGVAGAAHKAAGETPPVAGCPGRHTGLPGKGI